MFQRILVPLDGSSRAEQAVPVAACIARATPEGRVVLVRVMPPAFQIGAERGAVVHSTRVEPERLDIVAYLTRITGWPVLSGIPTTTEVRLGPPAPAILGAAAAHTSDLIVITSHGRTGLTRWALGSVAQQVARHAEVPVLILREHAARFGAAPGGTRRPLRVLVPLDGSLLAEEAVRPASELALAMAGPRAVIMHLVLVVSPYEAGESQMPEALTVVGAQEYLRHVSQRLEADAPTIRVQWRIYAGLDIAYSILHGEDIAAQQVLAGGAQNVQDVGDADERAHAYDLLAMSTHGRTGMTRWATGSITERVLQQTSLPVLVVRAHAAGKTLSHDASAPANS